MSLVSSSYIFEKISEMEAATMEKFDANSIYLKYYINRFELSDLLGARKIRSFQCFINPFVPNICQVQQTSKTTTICGNGNHLI